jgi:putative membrane protein
MIDFPTLNAILNGSAAILLVVGRVLIGQRRINAHRNVMIGAFCTSALFLVSYLYYHFAVRHGQPTRFPGIGAARTFYFVLLGTHTTLAAVMVPMILMTLRRGLRRDDAAHRRIARWTYPIWMYVSVTGVIIYLMLYRMSW